MKKLKNLRVNPDLKQPRNSSNLNYNLIKS
jgi:hypothetical protein